MINQREKSWKIDDSMGSDISENETEESDENDVDNWEEKTEKMEPDERRNTWERLKFFDLEGARYS